MKHVSISVLSTQFSVVVAFAYDETSHFFPFPEVSFHFIQCTCRSFRSRTVMAHHKSRSPPSRLNNGYGIFDQSVVLQLSPPVSFVLLYGGRNESYDLQDIKIERSKFRYSSWVHPKYRSDELRPKVIISVVKYALANLLTSAVVGRPFTKGAEKTGENQWNTAETREEGEANRKNLRDQRAVMRDSYQRHPAT